MEQNIAGFSLSPQQRRVWSLQSLGPGNPCRVQGMITIRGEINPSQLKRSLQMVIAKHEILRTVFRRSPGVKVPFQVILENTASGWEEFEISNLGPAEQGAKLRELADQQRATAFDHELGPPVHGALCKLSASRHVLLLDISSLCADSSSLKNIAVDLARAYSTGSLAQDEVLQYADFVEWQNALLEAEETKAGRDYWQDYCRVLDVAGITSLCLPLERKPPAETAFEPSLLSQPVGEETVAKLEKSSVDIGVSPAEFLLACWNALLARLTGRSQITVGFGCDGRGFEDLQSAVGLFHRYLPVQSKVEDELSFAAFAKRVKETLSEAVRWQGCFTFEQLETHTANSGFQYLPILFDYEATPPAEQVGTLAFTLTQTYSCFDRFNIRLSCLHESGALRLTLEYDRHSYSLQAVKNVASALSSVISAAANNPEAALCTLPILSERERERVLEEWNGTGAEYPRETIPEMFAGQVARTPDRTAVVSGEQRLSYAELNRRSNRLAHYLRRKGVGPDVPVGLCGERSAELMVGLMAILKAGGAYVPLNPDTPKLRLEQQLAGAGVLLTQKKLLPQMPSWGGPILCLDSDEQRWAGESGENPVPLAKPEHLVYIIYTSGSTGVPKGVAVTHANLVNYSWFMQRRLELEKYPQGLQFATVSTLAADLGNTCIYPALISGGTLHLIPYEVATDSGQMAGYNRKHRIDVLKIVPSHLAALLSSGEAMQVLPDKYLVLGGEALTPGLVGQIRAWGAGCEVLNHYGPTETTVGSLTLWLGREWQDDGQSVTVPIGRPIANTRVYVLDRHQQPVPVGVVGELYIGGAGVARGYLHRPELAAERFLQDPFTQEAGARMYRTGDLVRYRPDGTVEFLGRGDDQVKVRGFRIELGEIEALLSECAGVRQVVVVARSNGGNDKRLVAYLTVAREQAPTPDQLRHYLKDRLPEYMIPSAFVLLDKLPLNANGKIDRQALPAPEQVSTKTYVPPRTPTEQVVASIWAEVLQCGPVSIEDNFFDLGGHSLLATQVTSRLRRTFEVKLPLRSMFESPTVTGTADQIEKIRRAAQGPPPPRLERVSRDNPLPLSFAQQRLWFLDQLEPNNPLYNLTRAVRISGDLDLAVLERSLNEIVRRHESQRTIFKTVGGGPLQFILPELNLKIPLTDLGDIPENTREEAARKILTEESQQTFNLETGPLLRGRVLRLKRCEHLLALSMHHIVSDAWSAGILFQELGTLYRAFSERKPSPLADLPIQYADYAVWQRRWLQGKVLEKQMAHWRKQLEGAPRLLELPTDRPRPAIRSFVGSYETVSIPAEIVRAIHELSRRQRSTLFMTLLAAFQTLLWKYTGQDQVVVGTDVANRTRVETEKLIGFFINLLALRTDLSGDPSFNDLLERVRQVTLAGYDHQDFPFEKLVQELQPERNLSHNPLVQVLFVMQNIPQVAQELGALKLSPVDLEITRSKFDLGVFMADREDEVVGYWLYSTELFDSSTIRSMAAHYETLLSNIIANADARISTLEYLSEAEQRRKSTAQQERKQSQLKKLLKVEAKVVDL